jgi:hypothetical protein
VDEIIRPMDALLARLGKNATFNRAIAGGTTDGSGNFRFTIGPPTGFIWSIRWMQWSGHTGNINMYIGDNSSLNLIGQNFGANTSAQTFPSETFLVYAPDQYVFTQGNISSDINSQINVQLGVVQVPFGHEAQLL